jgi:hypothetical protein
VVVPDGDPRELGVREEQVAVGAVRPVPGPVVVQAVGLAVRERVAVLDGRVGLVLVDVVAEVQNVVDRLFADGVGVGVEVALGCVTVLVVVGKWGLKKAYGSCCRSRRRG